MNSFVPIPGDEFSLSVPPDHGEPLPHAGYAEAGPVVGRGAHTVHFESCTVVFDDGPDVLDPPFQHDADAAGPRVFEDVGQSLLHDPIEDRLDLGRKSRAVSPDELQPRR